MSTFANISVRFPEHELAIRLLARSDEKLLAVCEDYNVAVTALRHWAAAGSEFEERVSEYQQCVAELEAEILALLEGKSDRNA